MIHILQVKAIYDRIYHDWHFHLLLCFLFLPFSNTFAHFFMVFFQLVANFILDDLMWRWINDTKVNSEGSNCKSNKDKRRNDAEKCHFFAESDDETDVEQQKLIVLCWCSCNFLKHIYYLLRIERILMQVFLTNFL